MHCNVVLQVLRNFDGMISTAVTQQLVESGVKVLSNTQVRVVVPLTFIVQLTWEAVCC